MQVKQINEESILCQFSLKVMLNVIVIGYEKAKFNAY